VTHPFHPWSGRAFLLVGLRQTWGEDRVLFVDEAAQLLSLPVAWTDAGPVDAFVRMAAGRCPFKVDDLLLLARMIVDIRAAAAVPECQAVSAVSAREIMPSGRTLRRRSAADGRTS